MEVSPNFPMHTVPEFIAYAKANPGKIRMACGRPGEFAWFVGRIVRQHGGDQGDARAIFRFRPRVDRPDERARERHVRRREQGNWAGQGRTVTGSGRDDGESDPAVPDIPPVGNFFPGYEAVTWQGIAAPRDTPTAIVALLNKAVNTALADRHVRRAACRTGLRPLPQFTFRVCPFYSGLHCKMA